ncbi:High potential iron-sulfur protein [Noviherbaspirillum humi]|uniref:High-potential iron-sulfur protein n=1 Tax=Noviherbaspirillum humi TaxID=1688639 RepID=A0A239M2Q8_9BURK|nr:high-potential iron-sulfur protein [Noviherbaspirillum humi]SNT36169.1 High potential iron-sulfur protein [Noviherbaspirillum humi]
MENKRRIVIKALSAAGAVSAVGLSPAARAQTTQKVDPKDPQATSLGYVDDTKQADKKRFPKHEPAQMCSNCQFYQTASEKNKIAPCTIFANKGVAAGGWCSAWAKKAG